MKDYKKTMDSNSSADNVDEYLQELEKADYERLYYSQEQPFSSDELVWLINEERLNELMAQSDAFLSGLNGELKDFENDNKDP